MEKSDFQQQIDLWKSKSVDILFIMAEEKIN